MKDTQYQLFTLPHGFGFDRLTRSQARENLRAMMERFDFRKSMLQDLVRQTLPDWSADMNDGSLVTLGEWFVRQMQAIPMTEDQMRAELRHVPSEHAFIVRSHIRLTPRSYSIAVDTGVYVGECIRSRAPIFGWTIGSGPQSYVNYNQPILTADGMDEFNPMCLISQGIHFLRVNGLAYSNPPCDEDTLEAALQRSLASLPARDPSTLLVDMVRQRVNLASRIAK